LAAPARGASPTPLALGRLLPEVIVWAKAITTRAIARAPQMGFGRGRSMTRSERGGGEEVDAGLRSRRAPCYRLGAMSSFPRLGHIPVLALVALLSACAHAPAGSRGVAEEGEASYYARFFEGRRTASGARLDSRAFTCAHRTLPFGTRLHVTDLDTGKQTRVVVTDRGPFVRGRIVDLSPAAARELGILERGRARVRIEVLP